MGTFHVYPVYRSGTVETSPLSHFNRNHRMAVKETFIMKPVKHKKTTAFERKRNTVGALFLLPMLIMVGTFIMWPLVDVVRYSFFDWNGISSNMTFVGLYNYKALLNLKYLKEMLLGTFFYSACVTFLTIVLSFIIALALDQNGKGHINRNLLRALWFFPCLLSLAVSGMLWKIVFNYNNGIANYLLKSFGRKPVNWLETPGLATVAIVVASVWATVGMCIVIFLAGLQSIDHEYYEAAAIDGASSFQQLTSITLPLMGPSITVNVLTTTISTFKMYELPKIITNGGPRGTTMLFAQKIYELGLEGSDFGRGSAVSVVLILIITVISIIQFVYLRKKEDVF